MLNGNVLTKDAVGAFEDKGKVLMHTGVKDYKELTVVQAEDIPTGSSVYIKKHLGTKIDIDGEIFIVIDKRDIILIK